MSARAALLATLARWVAPSPSFAQLEGMDLLKARQPVSAKGLVHLGSTAKRAARPAWPPLVVSLTSLPSHKHRAQSDLPYALVAAAGTYNAAQGGTTQDSCKPCKLGQSSVNGSRQCTICAEDHYLPANASASECTQCPASVSCGVKTIVKTLHLNHGYWRHSNGTMEMHLCKSDGSWSPCHGGLDAGHEGDGYCAPGHHGPRCELCDGP
eukprot:2851238-Prymnesium_polylepis.1